MIKCKPGVRIFGLQTEMLFGLKVAEGVWRSFGYDVLTITSAVDSVHSPGSLHYAGAAVDLRSKDIDDDHKRLIVSRVRECLTSEFDFILESQGQTNEHFHLEFQPKSA